MTPWTAKAIKPLPILMIGVMLAAESALAAQAPGEVLRDCDVCPEMVVLPSGSFVTGAPDSEAGRWKHEEPQQQVTIDDAFAVGIYEVTFEEWNACVRARGRDGHEPDDRGWGRGRRPVINVSWNDAWRYADCLTERTGEEYRLLSEAEREYMARAGTQTERYWDESSGEQCRYANGYDAFGLANYPIPYTDPAGCRDRQATTAPVGSYRPSGFGLYDVLGNVEEWVDACWNESYEGAPLDESPWYGGDCTRRMSRDGGWHDSPDGFAREVGTGSQGFAEGVGKAAWFWNDGGSTETELLQGGRRQGFPVIIWSNGKRYEGSYVNREEHGTWTFIWSDGTRYTGQYVNGERGGRWTDSWTDARVEGPYVNAEPSRTWTYVNGERHGTWSGYGRSSNRLGTQRFESGRRVVGGLGDPRSSMSRRGPNYKQQCHPLTVP